MTVSVLLAFYGFTLLALGFLLLLTVRQVGILSLRIGPSGSRTTADGPALHSDQSPTPFLQQLLATQPRLAGRNILVAFVSPYCLGCRMLLPVLNSVAHEEKSHLQVIAVSRSVDWRESAELQKEVGAQVLIVEDERLFEDWNIHGTPYCVVLDEHGRVAAKGIANTAEHIESLLTAMELGTPTFEDFKERQMGLHAPKHDPERHEVLS